MIILMNNIRTFNLITFQIDINHNCTSVALSVCLEMKYILEYVKMFCSEFLSLFAFVILKSSLFLVIVSSLQVSESDISHHAHIAHPDIW